MDNSAFTTFFTSANIRIAGTVNEPLFCFVDIANKILDQNYKRKIKKYTSDYIITRKSRDKMDRKHEMYYLTEIGLYKYLLQSNLPAAEPFQRWVYSTLQEHRKRLIDESALALKIANDRVAAVEHENIFLRDNMDNLAVSVYDDARLDSCPLGMCEFYIARYIASCHFNKGIIPFTRACITKKSYDYLYSMAQLHFRHDHRPYKELVEETLDSTKPATSQ